MGVRTTVDYTAIDRTVRRRFQRRLTPKSIEHLETSAFFTAEARASCPARCGPSAEIPRLLYVLRGSSDPNFAWICPSSDCLKHCTTPRALECPGADSTSTRYFHGRQCIRGPDIPIIARDETEPLRAPRIHSTGHYAVAAPLAVSRTTAVPFTIHVATIPNGAVVGVPRIRGAPIVLRLARLRGRLRSPDDQAASAAGASASPPFRSPGNRSSSVSKFRLAH